MSIPNKTTINCPHCSSSFTTTVWSSVNTDLSNDLAEKVVNGTFFDAKCPKCGFVSHMEYDLLYHDMIHHAMIWVVHNEDQPEYDKKVQEIKDTAIISKLGFTTRIVHGMNELREKAASLVSGKDDRIVELCKVFVKYEVVRQNAKFRVRNVFYTYANGKDIMFLYDKNGEELQCYLEPELYHTMETIFSDPLNSVKQLPYAIYDNEWAEAFFAMYYQDRIESEKSKAVENTAPLKQPEVAPISSDEQVEKTATQERINWIKQNPFYLLRVLCTDTRRKITATADEMSFLLDADICANAQNTLISPAKRLSAELDWFFDVDSKTLDDIRNSIDKGIEIPTDDLQSISKFNATVYDFSLSDESDYFEIGYSIIDIDTQFSTLDESKITEGINLCRSIAKMTEVPVYDVSTELSRKRESVRQIISDRLSVLETNSYIGLVTMLAEKCIADEEYDDGVILSDVIDQYELRMQSSIEESTEQLKSHIARIQNLTDNEAINENIIGLINRVKKWDIFVQPLQLKSKASGMPHEISEDLGHELRNLALILHNEKGQTEAALSLVNAMRAVFSELGNLSEIFSSDSSALSDLLRNDKEAKEMVSELDSLQELGKSIKLSSLNANLTTFISRIKALNSRIKACDMESELIIQIRENLCYMARDVVITLHNDKHQTENALTLAKALASEFNDIATLRAKLDEDVTTLYQQLQIQDAAHTQSVQQEQAERTKRNGCLVSIGIVVLIIIIIAIIDGTSSGSSSPKTNSSPSYTQSQSTSPGYSSNTYSSSTNTSGKAQLKSELDALETEISSMETRLNKQESNINYMESQLEDLSDDIDYYEQQYNSTGSNTYYNSYNDAVDEYNDLYENYSDAIDDYNGLYDVYSAAIVNYNSKVNEYNKLN